MRFVDLSEMSIPRPVVEMIPESVAREDCLIPIAFKEGVLCVALADANSEAVDTLEKLAFILNYEIEGVLADRAQIVVAISRHYGQGEYDGWVWE